MRQHRQCLPYTQTRRLQLNMLVNFFLLWLCSLGPALCTPCLPAFGSLPTSWLALSLSPIHGRIKLGRIKSPRVHAISVEPLCLRHTTRMVPHSITSAAAQGTKRYAMIGTHTQFRQQVILLALFLSHFLQD